MRSLIGALVGGLAGFVLGVAGWLTLFYVVAMVPRGIPLRSMDQGSSAILITGPLGAIIGAVIGGFVLRRRFRPVAIAVILASAGIVWVLMKLLL